VFFEYGDVEIDYLKSKDKKLGAVIGRVGHVYRIVDDDLFSSVVHHIVGQQISTKAMQTIWDRMLSALGVIDAATLASAGEERIQAFGITHIKARRILSFADKVKSGDFDLGLIASMPDEDAIKAFSSLEGVGVWTAEMLLLFCLKRPNILSYGDLAIQRGMRMIYRKREIKRDFFEKIRRRLSPYCSVASLYFWAVAGGAFPELTDPAKRGK